MISTQTNQFYKASSVEANASKISRAEFLNDFRDSEGVASAVVVSPLHLRPPPISFLAFFTLYLGVSFFSNEFQMI